MTTELSIPELKLCIDCKHVVTNRDKDSSLYKCFSPQNPSTINRVDGSKVYKNSFCSTHRSYDLKGNGYCTITGDWFEKNTYKDMAPPVASPQPVTPKPISVAGLKKLSTNNITADDL